MTEFEFETHRVDMLYKGPIQIVQEQISSIESQLENETLKVIHKYGIYVDKDELIKALKYDRQQYDKGFDGNEEYVPIYTCKGVVFVKASYFKPFENDEYVIYERTANDDITYLVIKVGMFVQALIILNYLSVDFQAVTYFRKIAAGLRKTYENETFNDTENEKGVKQ